MCISNYVSRTVFIHILTQLVKAVLEPVSRKVYFWTISENGSKFEHIFNNDNNVEPFSEILCSSCKSKKFPKHTFFKNSNFTQHFFKYSF